MNFPALFPYFFLKMRPAARLGILLSSSLNSRGVVAFAASMEPLFIVLWPEEAGVIILLVRIGDKNFFRLPRLSLGDRGGRPGVVVLINRACDFFF